VRCVPLLAPQQRQRPVGVHPGRLPGPGGGAGVQLLERAWSGVAGAFWRASERCMWGGGGGRAAAAAQLSQVAPSH
jgi:hypothetical protein